MSPSRSLECAARFHHICVNLRASNGAGPVGSISWNGSIANPNVDQWLHGFGILIGQKTVELCHGTEVDKAGIEISPAATAEMPERVNPVRMVDVSVDTEDLTEAGATIVEERLREARAFAEPLTAS